MLARRCSDICDLPYRSDVGTIRPSFNSRAMHSIERGRSANGKRRCAHQIIVPHPEHDNFISDPTLVSVIAPQMSRFDRGWAAIDVPRAAHASVHCGLRR